MRGLQLQEVADAVGVNVGTLSAWLSRKRITGLVKPKVLSTGATYDIGQALLVALYAEFDRLSPDAKGIGQRAWLAYQRVVPFVAGFLNGERSQPGDDVYLLVLRFRSHEEPPKVCDGIDGLEQAVRDGLNRGAAGIALVPFSRVFAPILARWVEANPELLSPPPLPTTKEAADV